MNRLAWLITWFLLSGEVFAGRVLNVPTIRGESVSGGQSTSDGGKTAVACATADVLALPTVFATVAGTQTSYAPLAGAWTVSAAYHKIHFDLKNISTSIQNLTIILLPSSTLSGENSGGVGVGATINSGVSPVTFPSPNYSTNPLSLSPGQATEVTFEVYCNSANCFVRDAASNQTVAGAPFDLAQCQSNPAVCVPQVCMGLKYSIDFQISIQNDAGAVLGHVSTDAHRINGLTDHYLMPPMALDLNGGRPF